MTDASPCLRKPQNGSGHFVRESSIKIRVARVGALALRVGLQCIAILRVGLRAI